jgi:hypothetical protein
MDASDDHEGTGVAGPEASDSAGKRSLFSALRQPRGKHGAGAGSPQPAPAESEPDREATETQPVEDGAAVQVMAHGVIADLFGAGLRIEQIASRAPVELQPELEEVADHIDKVVREVRAFAFQQRS